MTPGRRAVAWGVVDQALSSATNFGGAVLAARALSADAFGAVAVAFAAYVLLLGVSRAATSEPLLIRSSASDEPERRVAVGRALGAAAVLAAAAGLLVAAVGLSVGSSTGGALVVLGVVLPALLLQDVCRHALVMDGRAPAAAANDGLWLVVVVVAFASAPADLGAASAVACWGIGAVAAAVLGLAQVGVRPDLRVLPWWRTHSDLAPRYVAELLLVTGTTYVLTFGVAALAGLHEAGALRGAQVLLGPVQVLALGVGLQGLPWLSRRLPVDGPGAVRVGAVRIAVGLALATCAWAGLLLLAPDGAGRAVLGPTWDVAEPLVPALALVQLAVALSIGPVLGLRALADARRSLANRAIVAPLAVAAGTVGAVVAGSLGAATGLALANVATIPLWWATFLRSAATPRSVVDLAAGTSAPAPQERSVPARREPVPALAGHRTSKGLPCP